MKYNHNNLCPYCLTTSKYIYKCGRCGRDMITISYRARIPSPNAGRKAWASLFKEFPAILIMSPYTKALARLGFKSKKQKTI